MICESSLHILHSRPLSVIYVTDIFPILWNFHFILIQGHVYKEGEREIEGGREREWEGEGEREKGRERNFDQLTPVCATTGDQTCTG